MIKYTRMLTHTTQPQLKVYKTWNKKAHANMEFKSKQLKQGDSSQRLVCPCAPLLLHFYVIACTAKRVWEFQRNSDLVSVINTGIHTCV